MVAVLEKHVDDLVEYGLAETRYNKMSWAQRNFANHLLRSWGHREFFTGKPIECYGNYHVSAVRRAIKTTLERRP